MNTNTNTNTNNQTRAKDRAKAIERARANEWEHGLEYIADQLNDEAAELTGDDNAEALFSLCYCQGDGVAIETTATIRRLDHGQPLEFTGLARRVWNELTGAERRALGRFITFGGESVTLTSVHGNYRYYHKYTLEFGVDFTWFGPFNGEVHYNLPAPDYAEAVMDRALDIFERIVHELCDQLESTGYAEIEAALDYAEERAAEEWDAENGVDGVEEAA